MNDKKDFHAMFSLKSQLRREWPLLLLIAANLVVALALYPQLPDMMPGHWNINNEVDRYVSRSFGAFGMPLITLGIYFLMTVVPALDPRKNNYLKFSGAYRVIKAATVIFMVVLHVVTLLVSIGYAIPVDKVVLVAISLLIMIIGNYLGRLRHNYFTGIKLPWTLASEKVWNKTHRLAGPLWVLAGLAGLLGAFFGGAVGAVIFFTTLGIAVLVPVIYSYLLYKRLNGSGS